MKKTTNIFKFAITIALVLITTSTVAQIYQNPTVAASADRRRRIDSTLLIPTGCGAPWLLSTLDLAQKHAAEYFDSCNHRKYVYDPKLNLWDTIHVGAAGVAVVAPDKEILFGTGTSYTSSPDWLINTSGGSGLAKVGLNVANPLDALHVDGSIRLRNGAGGGIRTQNGKTRVGDWAGQGNGNVFDVDDLNYLLKFSGSASATDFTIDDANATMYVDDILHDYKVGFNTNVPDSNFTNIGSIRLDNGRAQPNYVLTSTGTNGGADWMPGMFTFDATVEFSVNANPNTGGTTFNPNTPNLTTVIYVSTINGSQWTWNGTAYVTYTPIGWGTFGNSGTDPATHFIGTTDNKGLRFRTNNITAGYLDIVNFNTSFGASSLKNNSTGQQNIALGQQSLFTNTSGGSNIAIGLNAMYFNTTGGSNIAIGTGALTLNTTGSGNTAINGGLGSNTTGYDNVGIGNNALGFNNTGFRNTAVGFQSFYRGTTGQHNTMVGADAFVTANTASFNTGIGALLGSVATGSYNTIIGAQAASTMTTGHHNTFLGDSTGLGLTTGSNNTILGARVTGLSTTLANNVILADGAGNIKGQATSAGAWRYQNYGAGTFTGTPTYNLQVDASGNIIEGAIASAGADALGTYLVQTATNAPANAQIMASLATGLVKNTTTTGVQSIAVAGTDYQLPITNPVTGTGTLNFVPKWSSSSALGNSLITDNATTVGIISPATTTTGLDISSSTITTGALATFTNTGTAAASNTKKVLSIVSSGANATSSQTVTGQSISVTNTGTTNTNVGLSVSASGATTNYGLLVPNGIVGIGTSTPTSTTTLEVSSSTSTKLIDFIDAGTSQTRLFINRNGGGGFSNRNSQFSIGIIDAGLNAAIRFLTLGSGKSYIDAYSEGSTKATNYDLVIGSRGNNTTNSITNNTTFDEGTNVQIGFETNTIPSSILTLNTLKRGFLLPRLTNTQMQAISSPATGLLVFNTDSATIHGYNGSNWQKYLTANASGNVGIGTTTPTRLLQVGSINPVISLKQATTNQEYSMRVGLGTGLSSQKWDLYDNTSGVSILSASSSSSNGAKVAIGTTSPYASSVLYAKGGSSGANIDAQADSTKLDEGNIEVMSSDYTNGKGLALRHWGNVGVAGGSTILGHTKRNLALLDFTEDTAIIRTNTIAPLFFGINNVERMRLDSSTLSVSKIRGYLNSPSITVNTAGAGTGATASLSANSSDVAGELTVSTGSAPSAGIYICQVTFASSYSTAPFVTITASSDDAGSSNNGWYVTTTTTGFKIYSNSNGNDPLASASLKFMYHVIQ